ncbi:MAG: anti-sigma factor [Pseudomonadota bacterium]
MSGYEEKLSAFLDGELPEAEARNIEAALARDPSLQAELDALIAADAAVGQVFEDMLAEPVPVDLARAIRDAPLGEAANRSEAPRFGLSRLASVLALAMLGLGAAGGYLAGVSNAPEIAAPAGWLADIADYHAVYAGQTRHLVEVGADEADHIETWLTATVGAPVNIPDLSGNGLTFQGGRLLVAAGKPVAQLMFTDVDGDVVALCLIRSETPQSGFETRAIGAFDMVTWGGEDANFVMVGDRGREDLSEIARRAATEV